MWTFTAWLNFLYDGPRGVIGGYAGIFQHNTVEHIEDNILFLLDDVQQLSLDDLLSKSEMILETTDCSDKLEELLNEFMVEFPKHGDHYFRSYLEPSDIPHEGCIAGSSSQCEAAFAFAKGLPGYGSFKSGRNLSYLDEQLGHHFTGQFISDEQLHAMDPAVVDAAVKLHTKRSDVEKSGGAAAAVQLDEAEKSKKAAALKASQLATQRAAFARRAEQGYKCRYDGCVQIFAYSNSRDKHERNHHGELAVPSKKRGQGQVTQRERKHKCEHCNQGFAAKRNRDKHQSKCKQ